LDGPGVCSHDDALVARFFCSPETVQPMICEEERLKGATNVKNFAAREDEEANPTEAAFFLMGLF
jgi:hypothetical protein